MKVMGASHRCFCQKVDYMFIRTRNLLANLESEPRNCPDHSRYLHSHPILGNNMSFFPHPNHGYYMSVPPPLTFGFGNGRSPQLRLDAPHLLLQQFDVALVPLGLRPLPPLEVLVAVPERVGLSHHRLCPALR